MTGIRLYVHTVVYSVLNLVWILNIGLMTFPNLMTPAALTPELVWLSKEYKQKIGGTAAEGGTYADFH